MSQLSLSLDFSLLVRDDQGRYLPATADQILEAAHYVIDQKIPRGTLFTSPVLVKDYLRTKVAGFEWGTGFYINPTPPEDAAAFLRDIRE